ncbi:MAG: hypothetical protein F9K27_06280 [Anaerolineae bacterium]|nr:MAG: hypothetical protein F9K27_06280 [Anaerolineae bacterium]
MENVLIRGADGKLYSASGEVVSPEAPEKGYQPIAHESANSEFASSWFASSWFASSWFASADFAPENA